ncbi:MAG: arylamine N-acetyltransferase [Anaerofustis stercorihominis]|nr:arylamine N-acetyltransferase [Anaerofustis stercorihominis]
MYSGLYAPIPDIDKYLERIGLSRPEKIDLESLNAIINAHQLHIPYDSLDVGLLNREISLNIEDLFNKIIINKRGGYCFEINGLFMKLLKDLGFDTHSIPCRVMQTPETIAPAFHRGTVVKFGDKKYFCDVGCGGSMPTGAVEITDGLVQQIGENKFVLKKVKDDWYHLFRIPREDEENQEPQISLAIGMIEYDPVDFLPPNYMCSVGPNARFRDKAWVNMRTETGSVSIRGRELTVVDNHHKTVRTIENDEEYLQALKKYFGIDLYGQI